MKEKRKIFHATKHRLSFLFLNVRVYVVHGKFDEKRKETIKSWTIFKPVTIKKKILYTNRDKDTGGRQREWYKFINLQFNACFDRLSNKIVKWKILAPKMRTISLNVFPFVSRSWNRNKQQTIKGFRRVDYLIIGWCKFQTIRYDTIWCERRRI